MHPIASIWGFYPARPLIAARRCDDFAVSVLLHEDAVQNDILLGVVEVERFFENRDVEIYDLGLVEQNASVSPLVYLLSAVVLMMVCLSLCDFLWGWLQWR